ncbi:hypothetical protein D3C77_711050 [compost metagenome]
MFFRTHGNHRPVQTVAHWTGLQTQFMSKALARQLRPEMTGIDGRQQPRPTATLRIGMQLEGRAWGDIYPGIQAQGLLRRIELHGIASVRPW